MCWRLRRICWRNLAPTHPVFVPFNVVMMSADLPNPYEVTTGESRLDGPIFFSGELNEDDLRMTLRDAPPQKSKSQFQTPIMLISLVIIVFAGDDIFSTPGMPSSSFVPILVAVALTPLWLWGSKFLLPSYRRRVRRLKVISRNIKPARGWIDDNHCLEQDRQITAKMTWEYFGNAIFLPEQLMLPVATNLHLRQVLPWRWFENSGDAIAVCSVAAARLGNWAQKPLSDEDIVALFADDSEEEQSPRLDYQESKSWDEDQWPYESAASDQYDCEVDFIDRRTFASFVLIGTLAVVPIVVWFFLPVWIAAAYWITTNYRFYGDWSFLVSRPWSAGIAAVPIVAVLAVGMASVWGTIRAFRSRQSKPMLIRVRDRGIYLADKVIQVWITWEAISELIVTSKRIGWVMRETGDPVVFPKRCFKGDAMFEELESALQSKFAGTQQG